MYNFYIRNCYAIFYFKLYNLIFILKFNILEELIVNFLFANYTMNKHNKLYSGILQTFNNSEH